MTAAEPESPETYESPEKVKPRPLNSLVAASTRLTDGNLERFSKVHKGGVDDWQTEARQMYHLVGELRFLANMIGNRVGQARLHVAKLSDDPTADPDPINTDDEVPEGQDPPSDDDIKAVQAFQSVGDSPIQRAQMITRAAINLFTTADGYFVGLPPEIEAELNPTPDITGTLVKAPAPGADTPGPDELDLATLTWRFLSIAEVQFDKSSHDVTLQIGDSEKGTWKGNPNKILMFRSWRPDPFEWWLADSPTRSALPVLRELVGLTMAVSAQVDSRLAGAGVFLVPQTAKDAVLAAAGLSTEDEEDPFVDAIMEAMLTPISDRSNASALVPLILTVPDDTIEKFKHLKFSSDLDAQYQSLREEALSRFALSADAPPEALTGVGGMNHWGAWIVKEDTVTTHVEPPTAIICDAWTRQYLWPVLEAAGMAPEVARRYVIWYSVEHLIVRPNRFTDAVVAYDHEELSGDALRRYGGFTDDDAPTGGPDEAFAMVLQLIHRAPALAVTPGIPALVEQIRAVLANTDPTPGTQEQADAAASEDGVPPDPTATEAPPATESAPAEPGGMAASGADVHTVVGAITQQIATGQYGPLDLTKQPEPAGA